LDPAEDKDYSLDWSAEMTAVSDTIQGSTWALSPAAVAAGVESDQPSFDTTSTTLWLQVNLAKQSDAAFDGGGSLFEATNTITTTGGRTYERSAQFTVRQL
jgi:hypothetical protein